MAARYAPPTPTKLPAYKAPAVEAQRPPLPPATREGTDGDLVPPLGCELSVHNVYPTESLTTSSDVMDHALHVIQEAHPDLTPVSVTFRLKDTPTLCSIRLRNDVLELDANPRPDLLCPWIEHLRNFNTDWVVDWACATPSKDKRLWVPLKGIEVPVNKSTAEQLRKELQGLGVRTVGGFILGSSSSVVVNMPSLQSAENFRNRKSIKLPKFAKHPLLIDSFTVVQPEWAHELIITGIDHYDGTVKFVLDDYFSRTYMRNDVTLWHRSRIVDDAYYCFIMKDWEATSQVLRDKDRFEAKCSTTLPNLGFPRQIYELNTSGGFHESIARKLKMAGSSVAGNLSEVQSQLQGLRRDMDRGFDHMEKRIEAQQQDLRSLTNSVSILNDRVMSQSHSLLALQQATILQEQKATIETALMHKSLMFNTLPPEDQEKARSEMENLHRRSKLVERELESVRAAARGLAAPSLPTAHRENHATVTTSGPHMQAAQRQTVQPVQNNVAPVEETQAKKQATRVSVRNVQKNQNSPAKKRKTGDNDNLVISSQDAALLDVDVDMVSQGQGQAQQVQHLLPTTSTCTDITLRQVTTAYVERAQMSEVVDFVTPKCSRVITCRRVVHTNSLGRDVSFLSMKNSLHWIILLMFISMFVQCSAAATIGTSGLSFYALNANGMVNIGKLSQISSALNTRRPHILTISETKTSDKVGNKLNLGDYNFFEETGVKMDNHHLYKWGILVGVRKDIQIAQRLPVAKSLEGRVVALDLVIGTKAGKGFVHRFVGVYAPWNPGADSDDKSFWCEVAKICNSAAFSWSLAGDLNATVSATERASGGIDAKKHFLHFLDKTKGVDLWASLRPERSRLHDWT